MSFRDLEAIALVVMGVWLLGISVQSAARHWWKPAAIAGLCALIEFALAAFLVRPP